MKQILKNIAYIHILLLSGLFLFSCSSNNDIPEGDAVQISFLVDNFLKQDVNRGGTRATDAGTPEEQQIENVFVFLFDENGANPIKYFITATPSEGGSLVVAQKKITVNKRPAEVGKRVVHIVANCADLQAALNGVNTVADLNAVKRTTAQPWSPNITTPLLMYGSAAVHDFEANNVLNSVPLTRAVAKLELNITLTPERQCKPLVGGVAQYRYQLINFDKQTYIVKPTPKPADTVGFTNWKDWTATGDFESYTLTGNKVTSLKLVTYLNEADAEGAALKMIIPFGGMLPPPQFGEDIYSLDLPATINRNHWYKYDIEI